jgi:hypothetical protein
VTGAVLVAIPLLLIAATIHVAAVRWCSKQRDDDQETGDEHDESA